MSISSDVQKLEPGKRVRLIEVDGSAFGAGILRFQRDNPAYRGGNHRRRR
jgi:phage-related protein